MYDCKADLGVLYRVLQPLDSKWIKWKSGLKIATNRKPILKPPKAVARKLPVRYVAANYRSDALHGSHCRWVQVAGWFYGVRGFSIRPSRTTLTIVLRTRQLSLSMRKWKRLDRSSEVWVIYCSLCSDSQRSLLRAWQRSWQWPASSSKQAARATPKGLASPALCRWCRNANQPTFCIEPLRNRRFPSPVYEKSPTVKVELLSAGEGNRKYITPIFGEKSNRSNIKHIILLIINNLAIHLSLYINVNQ